MLASHPQTNFKSLVIRQLKLQSKHQNPNYTPRSRPLKFNIHAQQYQSSQNGTGPNNNSFDGGNTEVNPGGESQVVVQESRMKVYGIGTRGVSAVDRLLEGEIVRQEDACCLDANENLLQQCRANSVFHLDFPETEEASQFPPLTQTQINQIAKRPNLTSNFQQKLGVGFLITPSVGIPRGQDLIVQLLEMLKETSEFVVIALTLPFAFEGSRKRRQSQDVLRVARLLADMVFVLDQGVLENAPPDSPLTIMDVASISDSAFLHCVRTIMSSIEQPEVLSNSRGALQWISRISSIQLPLTVTSLLKQPGTASLARGMASVPLGKPVQELGGLMEACERLAEDAVRGAGASPFLKPKLENATAALCALTSLSPELEDHPDQSGPGPKNPGVKLAMRAAATMLRKIAGPQCNDIVVVWGKQPKQSKQQKTQTTLEIQIEATIVLLSVEEQEAKDLFPQPSERNLPRSGTVRRRRRAKPAPVPSNFAAMSALAGGSKSAPVPAFLEKEKKFQLALPVFSVTSIPLPKLPIPLPIWNLIKGSQMEGDRERARRERERLQELEQLEEENCVQSKSGFVAMLPESNNGNNNNNSNSKNSNRRV